MLPFEWIIWPIAITIAFVISFLIYKNLSSKYYKKRIENIQERVETIISLPIKVKLDKVRIISKYNKEYQTGYEVWEAEYNRLFDDEVDKINRWIDKVALLYKNHEIKECKIQIAKLFQNIELFEVDANKLMHELDELTKIEAIQKVEINKIKESFRGLKAMYDRNRINLEIISEFIDKDIKEIDELLIMFNDLITKAEFEKTRELIDEISRAVISLAKTIDIVPQVVTYMETIIPNRGNDLLDKYNEAVARGVNLDHISVLDNLALVQKKIDTAESILKTPAYLDSEAIINSAIQVISKLSEQIDREVQSKSTFDQIYIPTMQSIDKILNTYTSKRSTLKDYYNNFEMDEDQKRILKQLDLEMANLKEEREKFEASIRNMLDVDSYTRYINELEELAKVSNEAKGVFKLQLDIIENIDLALKRANDNYANFMLIVLETEKKLKGSQLSPVHRKYVPLIAQANTRLEELFECINAKPISVIKIDAYLNDVRDFVYELYNSVHNEEAMAEMAEKCIVYGNRFRSTVEMAETVLSQAEILFKAGNFERSIELTLSFLEEVQPGIKNALQGKK